MGDRAVRVLWLIKGLGAGGAERLLVSAARLGDHAKFEYEAAYVVPEKVALVPDLNRYGVRTHCLSRRHTPWPLALWRLLLDGDYDVVHVHSPLLAGAVRVLVRAVPRPRRPAIVSTEHNSWDSYSFLTRLLNASLHWTDQQRWAVSDRVRNSVWSIQRAGVEVLIHGIVLSDVAEPGDRPRLRRELGVAPDDVVAITVANFRPEKAYDDLLTAMAKTGESSARLRFLVVGQGPLESEVRRMHADLGLEGRCLILGYRQDVVPLLSASDLFVLGSRFEGFPIALMEAMAAGLPVVATKVGGVPDAVTHGREGLLAEPGAPDQLSEFLVVMAENESLRSSMAAASRIRGQLFDAQTAVATVESAYEQLALRRECPKRSRSRPRRG